MSQNNICIEGVVSLGKQLGRKLGFPTANVILNDSYDSVLSGVYAVRVVLRDSSYFGVANIGVRPTVTSEKRRVLEVHIFDFDRSIYGEDIEIELLKFLRNEQKFSSVELLREQIEKDKTNAQSYLLDVL